jgi:superfamily II DNA/RNA helicase
MKGKKHILITTDVASRGIDVKNVSTVIHYHCP